jgi:hypothetical protein
MPRQKNSSGVNTSFKIYLSEICIKNIYPDYKMSAVTLEWIKQDQTFNVVTDDNAQRGNIATDASGNSYITYFTDGTVSGGTQSGNRDIIIAKIDSNGNTLWSLQDSTFNTNQDEYRPTITIGVDGYIYIAFYTRGSTAENTSSGNDDIAIMKVSSTGVVQWVQQNSTFNTSDNDSRPAITGSADGTIYVTFYTYGTIPGGDDNGSGNVNIVVMKMDGDGTVVWTRQKEEFNSDNSNYPMNIAADSNNNVYVVYYSYDSAVSGGTNSGNDDVVVFKMDVNGNLIWTVQEPSFNTPDDDFFPVISINNQNDIFIAFITSGSTTGNTNIGNNDIAIMKMNTSGVVQWIRQSDGFDTTEGDASSYHFGITSDNSGNVYVAFHTYGSVNGQEPNPENEAIIVVTKLTTSGTVAWTYQMPFSISTDSNYSPNIDIDANGNLYIIYYKQGGEVSGGSLSYSDNDSIVVFKLTQGVANSFPASIDSSYLTLGQTIVYTKETVDAILNNKALPMNTRVSWAPNGLPSGTLLRRLGRKTITQVSSINPLYRYKFQQIQIVNGINTEGVSGSLSDIDGWGCGYICIWSSDGIAPTF